MSTVLTVLPFIYFYYSYLLLFCLQNWDCVNAVYSVTCEINRLNSKGWTCHRFIWLKMLFGEIFLCFSKFIATKNLSFNFNAWVITSITLSSCNYCKCKQLQQSRLSFLHCSLMHPVIKFSDSEMITISRTSSMYS